MNDFEYLPGSVLIGRITYDLSQPDDSPPYLVGYADTRGGSFLIRSLDRIDEQIADLAAGRKLLADALDRWYAPKAGALPVRESLAEHRARLGGDIGPLEPLPPGILDKPEPFVPPMHYIADDGETLCGTDGAPGVTVTASTDPAEVTCGLCRSHPEFLGALQRAEMTPTPALDGATEVMPPLLFTAADGEPVCDARDGNWSCTRPVDHCPVPGEAADVHAAFDAHGVVAHEWPAGTAFDRFTEAHDEFDAGQAQAGAE